MSKTILEKALLEAEQLEEAMTSNAKEILSSTMKEEIEELVKESLSNNGLKTKKVIKEQELEAMVDDDEDVMDMDDEGGDTEMEDVLAMADEIDVDDIPSPEGDDEFEPLDLTQASDEDVLKVFKAMGAEDGVIVKQDDDVISIEDEGTGEEYRIELDESKKDDVDMNEEDEDEDDVDVEAEDLEEDDGNYFGDAAEDDYSQIEKLEKDAHYDSERHDDMEETQEPTYEVDMDMDMDEVDMETDMEENYGGKKGDIPTGDRKKKGRYGRGGKTRETAKEEGEADFQEMYRGNNLSQKVHAGNRTNKFNKAAREKAGINMNESKRSIRTRFINERKRMDDTKILTETIDNLKGEVGILKNKNGEYKKALKMFRDKLNEVAVFNSNLAYATKLFTEHTTNKSEKINILRRFDSVESLKESKALYKNVKKQLSSSTKSVVTESYESKNSKKTVQLSESVQKKINKSPATGASKLRESRTYVDPQIARSLDIMSKIK